MKVLLVGHTYLAANNRPKLRSLAARGFHLNVLLPVNWRHGSGVVCPDEIYNPVGDVDAVDFFPCRIFRPGHIASHFFSPFDVCRIMARVRPDLVHIENEGYSYLAGEIAPVAKAMGVKTILFVWENIDKKVHWSQRICRRATLPIVDGLVCGSSGAQAQYRRWGFTGPTVIVPQLGVDTDLFRPVGRGARSGTFVVGYVGRLVPEKGIDVLLRAVRRLADSGIDTQCIIQGSGQARVDLQALAGELGIDGFTSFVDGVPHELVPEVIAKLDVLVLPSRTAVHWAEQLGHILLEGMSMGIVVVGARSGAIPEVIGKHELLFNEDDEEDLARILRELANRPAFYQECRAYGIDRIARTYTHDIIAGKLSDFWKSIITGGL